MLLAHVGVSLANSELHLAKGEEKQISSIKMSFEKQLQSERTLKTQVGLLDSQTSSARIYFINIYMCAETVPTVTQTYCGSRHSILGIQMKWKLSNKYCIITQSLNRYLG